MIKIRFNDSTKFLTCEFSRNSDHIVTLGGCKVENTSGFTTYRLTGERLGDFSDYTTIYRLTDDAVQYSNDSSTYVPPEPEPTPDPKPSEMDRIAAQTIYTALMTDTLIDEESNDDV